MQTRAPEQERAAPSSHRCAENEPALQLGSRVLWASENGVSVGTSRTSTVFSGAFLITVLQYVYTWLILNICGRAGPTGTNGNSVLNPKPRAQLYSLDPPTTRTTRIRFWFKTAWYTSVAWHFTRIIRPLLESRLPCEDQRQTGYCDPAAPAQWSRRRRTVRRTGRMAPWTRRCV